MVRTHLIVRDKFCGVPHREDAQKGGIVSPCRQWAVSGLAVSSCHKDRKTVQPKKIGYDAKMGAASYFLRT